MGRGLLDFGVCISARGIFKLAIVRSTGNTEKRIAAKRAYLAGDLVETKVVKIYRTQNKCHQLVVG